MSDTRQLLHGKIPCAETGIQVKRTICDICCPSFHCGIDAYVKGGKLIKIEGTAEHPLNHGMLCAKGLAGRQYVYREDRIRTPLRRTGERGSGQFEPISWEEAYYEISRRLLEAKAEYGAESVLFYSGYSKWYRPYMHRLVHSFGCRNYLTESSSCMFSTFLNWLVTTGNVMSSPDTPRCGVYLGWAYNPYYSRYLAALGVETNKERGMKVIIIDPRITPATQRVADLHLRPRPGTDGALALGLAHVLIRDDYVNQHYLDRYVYGYEAYKAYVQSFDPVCVQQLTGVLAHQIELAARMIGENLPLAISESAAPIAHHRNGLQNYRAIMALSAITGSFDQPGGQIPVQFSYNYQCAGFKTREQEFIDATRPGSAAPPVGTERFPLWADFVDEAQANDLARQINSGKPYPLKALMGFGYNHRIGPASDRMAQTLNKLDFLVNIDLFMTDTCKLCDIVLPACTAYERSELKAWGGGYITCTKPVIEPLFDSRSDVQIICDLAKAMNLDDELLKAGPEACYRWIIQDLPITLDELMEADLPLSVRVDDYEPGTLIRQGLKTKSGKFELYSLAIEKYRDLGFEPLPVYVPPCSPQEEATHSFLLCSGPRLTNAQHSRLHKVPWCRSLRPNPMADIHPNDAAKLGIQQEDSIELYNEFGNIQVEANLSAKVDVGTVYMFYGYSEADVNTLLDGDKLDPYSGFPAYRSGRVSIRKAD